MWYIYNTLLWEKKHIKLYQNKKKKTERYQYVITIVTSTHYLVISYNCKITVNFHLIF